MTLAEISPVIGLYRSGITSEQRLRETTIGRSELLADMLDKLRARGKKRSGINRLYIGPRGIGKTHLLSLLEHSIQTDPDLQTRYTVVRFPEESNRVLSFADLLLGIIEILGQIEPESDWPALYRQLHQQEQDVEIIDAILPRLKQYHRRTRRSLIIMLENLDVVLVKQIKNSKDIHRLRSFIMDNPHIIMVATAPVFFPALNDIKHPLYDFFDIETIDGLSRQQTLALIRKNLQWDDKQSLLQHFSELQPRILALHEMTGGNPRLIMQLYGLIAQDSLLDVKTYFHKLLDGITPFYQDRIKDLPPQERALLETLALMRDPLEFRTPRNIAKRLRKSVQLTSTLLKRMTDAGYLSVSRHPDDKRSRLYRIKEGFFDIWLAMNESRGQRRYLPYLVEFFQRWYVDQQERETKRRELTDKIEAATTATTKTEALEQLAYLSEADEPQERKQAKLALAMQQITVGVAEDGLSTLQEMPSSKIDRAPNSLLIWMHDQTQNWARGETPEPDIRQRMEAIIRCWSEQRIGELESASRLVQELSLDFSGSGLHKLNVALLEDQFDRIDDTRKKIQLCIEIARSQKMDGLLDDSLEALQRALALTKEIDDKALEGTTLNNISQIYDARGDYDTALGYLEDSLAIRRSIGDKSGEGTTLNNISQIYDARGDYDTALKYLEVSLAILRSIGDKSGEGTTLNNISQIYKARGDYDTALRFLEDSLAIVRSIGDKSGEGATLNNISGIYKARGDYDTALRFLEDSLAIRRSIGDKSGEGATLNNISGIYKARGDYDTALRYLEDSLDIRRSIGDKSGEGRTLNNISQIYDARGDYDTALRYLQDSLAIVRSIGDKSGEGTTLNNISGIYRARGDYDTALRYLEDSLDIVRSIGDKSGLCATLFNMGHLHLSQERAQEAMGSWLSAYVLAKEIGQAEVLAALDNLAEQLGLATAGGWANLAQRLKNEPTTPD